MPANPNSASDFEAGLRLNRVGFPPCPKGDAPAIRRGFTGARTVDDVDDPFIRELFAKAERDYDVIRGMSDDIGSIARNNDIPEQILQSVKRHAFFEAHEYAVGSGRSVYARFTADPEIADLWLAATKGPLVGSDATKFRRLLAHEYVEGLLTRIIHEGQKHEGPWCV